MHLPIATVNDNTIDSIDHFVQRPEDAAAVFKDELVGVTGWVDVAVVEHGDNIVTHSAWRRPMPPQPIKPSLSSVIEGTS